MSDDIEYVVPEQLKIRDGKSFDDVIELADLKTFSHDCLKAYIDNRWDTDEKGDDTLGATLRLKLVRDLDDQSAFFEYTFWGKRFHWSSDALRYLESPKLKTAKSLLASARDKQVYTKRRIMATNLIVRISKASNMEEVYLLASSTLKDNHSYGHSRSTTSLDNQIRNIMLHAFKGHVFEKLMEYIHSRWDESLTAFGTYKFKFDFLSQRIRNFKTAKARLEIVVKCRNDTNKALTIREVVEALRTAFNENNKQKKPRLNSALDTTLKKLLSQGEDLLASEREYGDPNAFEHISLKAKKAARQIASKVQL